MSEHISAHLKIERPLPEVFDFVRRPEHHSDFDATGTVGEAVTTRPIHGVGDAFTTEMIDEDADGNQTQYQLENRVTRFERGRVIEWAAARPGEDLLGWRWRYEFEPEGDAVTVVTLTYDWAGTSEQNRRDYGIPAFRRIELDASLALLDLALVAAHGDNPHLESD